MKKKLLYLGYFLTILLISQSTQAQCNSTNYSLPECGGNDLIQQTFPEATPGNPQYNALPAGDTFYVRAIGGNAWGQTANQNAMNQAFGAGNWTEVFFETLDPAVVFAPASRLAFIDGSDFNAIELNTFLLANLATIENWVNGGGVLLLNSAPNEGGNINFGFGGSTLVYNDPNVSGASNVVAPDPLHPVILGPFLPTSLTMSGNFYSHSNITGTGFSDILVEDGNPTETMLTEKPFGSGHVILGGMTTNNFHTPLIEAQNFTANLLVYLESLIGGNNPPEITCPANVTISTDPGTCEASYSFIPPTATDPEGGTVTVVQTMGPPSPGPFPLGTTIIEFTATNDTAPNETATCQYTVTVEDNEAPTVSCPGDQNESFNANCSFILPDYTGLASATDSCDPNPTITQTPAPGSTITGTTTITITATDAGTNSDSCNFDVILTDTTAPALSCPVNQNESVGPNCMFTIPDYTNLATATDNCGTVTLTQTPAPGTIVAIGTTAITLEATDGTNSTSCNFNVIVEDTTPPVTSCLNITIELDAMGMASITTGNIDGGTSDNCGVNSISLSQTEFDCSDVGVNQVTLLVTDDSGNTSSCVALVTVQDNIAPIAICQNITITLEEGEVEIDPIDIDNGSNDACGIQSLSLDIDSFDCSNLGDNDVILTVTDENGNVSTCTAVVTVEETASPPVAVCQNITIPLLEDGTATLQAEALNGGSLGLGCTGTFSVDLDTFDCSDIGDPIQVVLTVTNPNGVTDSCTAFVHVVDSLDPEIFCPDDQVIPEGNTPYTLPDYVASGEVFAEDNCINFTTIEQFPPAGTILEAGAYNISFIATDPSGNEDTCFFALTIEGTLGTPTAADLATLALYPNPAKDFVMVSNPANIEIEAVQVYDLAGRLVKTFAMNNSINQRLEISELATASYLLLIVTEDGQITKQIIKE
ncbi:MAG: hypothetical protein CMC70_07445 [Flavobacteriaceae bacterium]|nr:hypothetical protein [Flavobacteriaceae bacterium]